MVPPLNCPAPGPHVHGCGPVSCTILSSALTEGQVRPTSACDSSLDGRCVLMALLPRPRRPRSSRSADANIRSATVSRVGNGERQPLMSPISPPPGPQVLGRSSHTAGQVLWSGSGSGAGEGSSSIPISIITPSGTILMSLTLSSRRRAGQADDKGALIGGNRS